MTRPVAAGSGTWLASLLFAASLCAGCSAEKFPKAPTAPPLPSGQVLLATFSGEVDPVAGIVTIDTQPASALAPLAGSSARVIVEGTNTLSVSTVGTAWNGTVHGSDCAGAAATGADIKLTSGYTGSTFLAGVYAEITTISSGTGLKACDQPTLPPALVNTNYGFWYYGTITPGASVVKSWNWTTAGGSRFTFSGRLVGVKGTSFTSGLGAPNGYNQDIARLGTGMVHGVQSGNYLQYDALDGSSAGTSASLPAPANSIAVDAASGLVWFTTEVDANYRAWAGYVNTLDGSVVSLKPIDWNSPQLDGIVVDPDPGTGTLRAWLYSLQYRTVYGVTAGATPTVSSFPTGFSPSGLVFPSSGGGMLVAEWGTNKIRRYDRSGSLLATYDTAAAGCGGPQDLIRDASSPVVDGMIWFSGNGSGAVCSLSVDGVVTKVADVPNPRALAFDGDGSLWAVSMGASGAVHRVTPVGGTYALTLPQGSYSIAGIAYGPDLSGDGVNYLWVGNGGYGLVRLEE